MQNSFDLFHHQVENKVHLLREVVDHLMTRFQEENVSKEALIEEVFQEFSSALEELQVAQEELNIQNEELMEAQRMAELERQRYMDLFEGAPDGYVVTDDNGVIRGVNRAAEDLLGKNGEKLAGKPIILFVVPEDRRGVHNLLYELSRSGETRGWEGRMKSQNGPPFHAAIRVAPAPSMEGSRKALHWMIRDISERKRAEEQMKHYAEKLERNNRELQDFAFIASHDLQEPLRKIQTFSNLIITRKEKGLDETVYDYLARIGKSANRMSELIHALLLYSRVGTQGQSFGPVDLKDVVLEAVEDLEIMIKSKDAQIEVGDLPTIEADPIQMHQLFQNLIANALKYMVDGENPVIRIYGEVIPAEEEQPSEETHPSRKLARIFVEDNGIGFDEVYLDRIFRPFQRLHGRDEYGGTGMGLAICRKVVERHGGSITAGSEPGKGTVFSVTLPVDQSER